MTPPKFELAKLSCFSPSIIDPSDDADAFVLSLALAYNDLKDVHWMLIIINENPPPKGPKGRVTADAGQWVAMRDHATRMATAIVLEIVNAVAEADKQRVIRAPAFAAAVGHLNPKDRKRWKDLLELSRGEPGSDPIRKYLLRVRNNLASHYYQPKQLMTGFKSFFFDAPRTPFNEHCMLSAGKTMAQTRYFFADAAAQQARFLLDESGDVFEKSRKYFDDVNRVLTNLVESYLNLKNQRATGKPIGWCPDVGV